jgi:hypothetical protein
MEMQLDKLGEPHNPATSSPTEFLLIFLPEGEIGKC